MAAALSLTGIMVECSDPVIASLIKEFAAARGNEMIVTPIDETRVYCAMKPEHIEALTLQMQRSVQDIVDTARKQNAADRQTQQKINSARYGSKRARN